MSGDCGVVAHFGQLEDMRLEDHPDREADDSRIYRHPDGGERCFA